MKLNDPLVKSFDYDEVKYSIDLAFDNVLDVFDVLSDKELRDHERAEICLELLMDQEFDRNNVIDLWNYVFDQFIHTKQKQLIEYDRLGNALVVEEEEEHEKLMDLDQDAEFIFSSFIQAYGINLHEVQGKLHWHEFKALLNGLPNNTIMKRIIEIRAYEPSKHDSSEYKQSMEKMKRRFALDVEREEEE
ncbi:phage protein [Bacillus sp. JCM 19046]|nr:phage protein [Bacillus sp. JCM 19045]GAF18900.1 phage protein [Bacillus sp. JCM 19046]